MKKLKWLTTFTSMVLLIFLLGSCMSLGQRQISKKDLPGPENHTLIYGYLGYHTIFSKKGLDGVRFIQLNPEHPATLQGAFRPLGNRGSFFLYPQPTGSSLKLFLYSISGGNSTTYYYQGIGGKKPYDPKTQKPGLMYIGPWAYSGASSDTIDSTNSWYIRELIEKDHELTILKAMLPQFKGTDWYELIDNRIKELTQ